MNDFKEYQDFLNNKRQLSGNFGFKPVFMPDYLFDFQKYLVEWALVKGKSAIFADTGLGKTIIQLSYAENIVRKTNKNVLLLTPIAVGFQIKNESEKFGIETGRSRDGKTNTKITITNYEQLEKFNPDDFIAIVADESSIIKNFGGQTRKNLTRFCSKMKYRLLLTATPSPNDFVELGTSSEVLGELKYMDMVSQFFRDTQNDKNPQWSTPKYELKKHAINDFWRWVSSWSRALKKPSDLGFDDTRFILPKLYEKEIIVKCSTPPPGELFPRVAETLTEQKEERKRTLEQRVEMVEKQCLKFEKSVIWAHYNYETDYIEKNIKNAIQVSGNDSPDEKEEKFIAFISGEIKRLIIKPKIGAFGMNWQHCNHMTFFPSHSYEQYYQGVRRCWRFGQKKPVFVDIISSDGEKAIMKNIQRKTNQAQEMFAKLIYYMNDSLKIKVKNESFDKINLPEFI